ncbi:hypothetical protein ABID42_001365 [Arcicella rosea]|uniref:hypothetical protein n=1 Tax=Arcicella rosea TaxID=502909 RepID=UPI00345D53A5
MKYSFDDSFDNEFIWTELYYLEFEINLGLDCLKQILSSSDVWLTKSREIFLEKTKKDKILTTEVTEIKVAHYNDNYQRNEMLIDNLQILQGYSLCQSITSFFESSLKNVSEKVQSEFKSEMQLSKKKFMKIEGYYNYLIKVFGKVDIEYDELYQSIMKFYKIRNIIVHSGGISISGEKQIIVSSNDLNKILDKIALFFNKLLLHINNKYYEMKN